MSNIDKRAELRKELSNPANGSNAHLRKLALALLDELEVVNELFLRAKALMYQSGGTPIENSLNPIDAWLYDAERVAAADKGAAS